MKIICDKHPKYLGKRKPTSTCMACNALWNMIDNERGYSSVFGYNDNSYLRVIPEKTTKKSKPLAIEKKIFP